MEANGQIVMVMAMVTIQTVPMLMLSQMIQHVGAIATRMVSLMRTMTLLTTQPNRSIQTMMDTVMTLMAPILTPSPTIQLNGETEMATDMATTLTLSL